jgi:hypothetical protein
MNEKGGFDDAGSLVEYLEFIYHILIQPYFEGRRLSKQDMENGFFEVLKEQLKFLDLWGK